DIDGPGGLTAQTTSAQAAGASAANIQAVLQGLSNIGAGNVLVTASAAPGVFYIQFTGALAGGNQQPITIASSLTGGVVPAFINTAADGGVFTPNINNNVTLVNGANSSSTISSGSNRLVLGGNLTVTAFPGVNSVSAPATISGAGLALLPIYATAGATRTLTVNDS